MANLNTLVPIGILFVVAAIALSLGADVLTSVNTDQITGATNCTSTADAAQCGDDYNISVNGLQAVDELGSWIPTIALVVAASIIIGIVVKFLGNA